MPQARPLDPNDPERIGGHRLLGRIGQGAQGVVFLGRGPGGGRLAVKLLHARLGGDPLAHARLLRELEALTRIDTCCTAAVRQVGIADERPYLVGEYVAGPSLQELVAAEGPRGRGMLERLAVGTAAALAAVHRAGLVHLAFKPADVLLGADGPRVTDYGIVRALRAGGLTPPPGTPAYLAPEQLDGAEAGPAADVFAWGAVMLFAACGRAPFGEGPAPEVMRRILHEEPPLEELPPSLRGIVAGALAKDPAARPTARQVLDWLLGQESMVAGMPQPMIAEARELAAERPPRPGPVVAAAEPWPQNPVPGFDDPVEAPTQIVTPSGEAPAPRSAQAETAVYPQLGAFGERTATAQQSAPPWPEEAWQTPAPAQMSRPEPPPARSPSRANRPLGVLVSLAVGVLAGAAIIVLVLWPQLRDSSGKTGGSAGASRPAADNRPVTSVPEAFEGTWQGTAINQRRNATFPIRVTFRGGETTARAVYPRNCVCTLTLTRGTSVRLEMSLRPNPGCKTVTPGEVVVTRKPGGGLDYAWAKPGTSLSYRADLTRQ